MTFLDSLELNQYKNIKYLQFSDVKFLQGQQKKQSLIIDSVQTVVFNEIEIQDCDINFEIQIKNATNVFIQNFKINNTNIFESTNLFVFNNVQTVKVFNFIITNSNIFNSVFYLNQINQTINFTDFFFVNIISATKDIFIINNSASLFLKNMIFEPQQFNELIYILNVWNLSNKLEITDVNITLSTNTGLLFQKSIYLNDIQISNVVFNQFRPSSKPIIFSNYTNTFGINNLKILDIDVQTVLYNILYFQLSQNLNLSNINLQFKNKSSTSQVENERFIITLLGIINTAISDVYIIQNKQYGIIYANNYEIQRSLLQTCYQVNIKNLTLDNSVSLDQTLFNITSYNTILDQVRIINNVTSNHPIFVFNSLYQLEVQDSTFEDIYLKNKSQIFLIKQSAHVKFLNSIFSKISSNLGSTLKISSEQQIGTIVDLQNCTFTDISNIDQKNILPMYDPIGGSLAIDNIKEFTLQNSNFINVKFNQSGSAIYLKNVNNSTIESCNFVHCISKYQSGGAFYIQNEDGKSKVKFSNNLFEKNTALQEKGGAIYISNTQFELENNKIYDNNSTIGGFLYYDINFMKLSEDNRAIYLKQNTFQNNNGFFFGNNFGSIPLYIKQVKQINTGQNYVILNTTNVTNLLQFQSGNYTKDDVDITLQFVDEENNILNFTKISQINISNDLQRERESYKIYIKNNYKKEIQITQGEQLVLNQTSGLFKLNITASYKNIQTFSGYFFANFSTEFNDETQRLNIQFRKCIAGEIKQNISGQIICMECPENYYSFLDSNEKDLQCLKCPLITETCQGRNMILKDGYWRNSLLSDNIFECESLGCSESSTNPNRCSIGYVGPLCQSCDNNGEIWMNQFGYDDNRCLRCADANILYVKLAAILFFYIIYIRQSLKTQINNKINVIKINYLCKMRIFYFSRTRLHGRDSSILTKIFLNYIQIFSLSTKFLSQTYIQLKSLFDIGGDPSEATSKKYDCMFKMSNEYPVWLNRFNSQIVQIILTLLVVLFIQKIESQRENKKIYIKIYIIFFYLFYYPSFSKLLLSLVLCKNIEGQLYLFNDYQQECFTQLHLLYSIFLIYPVTIFWTIVIPIFLLKKMRFYILDQKSDSIEYVLSFYFLQQGYKEKYYYWEILRMFYKFLIMLVLNIFDFYIGSKMIALICHIYSTLLTKCQPLISNVYQDIEKLLTRILFYTLILQTFQENDNYGDVFKGLVIFTIIIMNVFGLLQVVKIYIQIQKFRFMQTEETSFKKYIQSLSLFKKIFPKSVGLLKISRLWKTAHQHLIRIKLNKIYNIKAKTNFEIHESSKKQKSKMKSSTEIGELGFNQMNKSQILDTEENTDTQYDPKRILQISTPNHSVSSPTFQFKKSVFSEQSLFLKQSEVQIKSQDNTLDFKINQPD